MHRIINFLTHATADTVSNGDKTIYLVSTLQNSYINVMEAAVKAAAQKSGYRLTALDAKGTAALQLHQVIGAQKRGCKAIIIILDRPNDAADFLRAAKDMKVVFLAVAPSDLSILNENAIFVGPDSSMVGKLQGQWLVNYFKQKGQSDINYILLQSTSEIPTIQTQSALQTLSKKNISATQAAAFTTASFSREDAKAKIIPILKSDLCFDAIISDHDTIALGAIDAMEYLGMDPRTVAIVSVNTSLAAKEAIKGGKMLMTVFQNPREQGSVAIAAMTNMLEGKHFKEGIGYGLQNDSPYAINILPDIVTKTLVPKNMYYIENETK